MSPGSRRTITTSGSSLTVPVVGMDEDLAEPARKRLVLRDVDLLVAEEHDAVLVQRVADLADRAVVEILRHVDAEDLRAAGAGQQSDIETAVSHLPLPLRRTGYTRKRASLTLQLGAVPLGECRGGRVGALAEIEQGLARRGRRARHRRTSAGTARPRCRRTPPRAARSPCRSPSARARHRHRRPRYVVVGIARPPADAADLVASSLPA